VLVGGPGVGKTTLWEAGLDSCRARGCCVLSARPSGADAQLAFSGLIDLLDGIEFDRLDGLPAPQRRALESALLRDDPDDVPAEPHAIRLALLNVLRALTRERPVVVALDDVQWLDGPSADALAFVARRLEARQAVFLLARRPGAPGVLERALEGGRAVWVAVGPLSFGAIRRMLSERLGLTLQRQVLRRVVETTLGNPLFALEIGRSFLDQGIPVSPEEIAVPEVVEEVLGTRVARLTPVLRRLLLAVALSEGLRVAQIAAIGGPFALDDAVDAGLLALDGDRVRASHPLLAAAARSRAGSRERRELHLELARVVEDEELRALHLALAADAPDAQLSATLSAAAAAAAARGAAQEAVSFAGHALRVTASDATERSDRVLQFAQYLEVAGDLQGLSAFLEGELDSLPSGAHRARAFLLLSEGGANVSNEDGLRYLERALVESGNDPLLRAPVLAKLSSNSSAIRVRRLRDAEAWAEEALAAARDDPEVERTALGSLSWARSLRGKEIDDLCQRFVAASDTVPYLVGSPDRVAAQRLVWRGEVGPARALLTEMRRVAGDRGEPVSYALFRLHLCELELRAGRWTAAEELLDEWAESSDDELLFWPMYERCQALLAAGRGLPEAASSWGAQAIARAEATGVEWDRLEALRAIAIAALLEHEPGRAADGLRAISEHTVREDVDEPGVFPFAPDLVEALTELGAFAEAAAVTERLGRLAAAQHHPWGLAAARRCAAVIELASGPYDERHAEQIEAAAVDFAALGLAFDHARTLLGLGRARRRARKWGAARSTLEQAASLFDELGSPGWAERAGAELARIGARKPQPTGELTPTEQRVAELAIEGMSNKEIAQALFVTVNTVEAHLSHAYAKLGIRSRAQLARIFAGPP
jgi:DNA-binding CsgD family transcriptional regulator